jgi:hypothetical protein
VIVRLDHVASFIVNADYDGELVGKLWRLQGNPLPRKTFAQSERCIIPLPATARAIRGVALLR